MNWKTIIKNSKLDTVQDTTMSIKPERADENCLRKLKTLIRELRRLRSKYPNYIKPHYPPPIYEAIGKNITEEIACYAIQNFFSKNLDSLHRSKDMVGEHRLYGRFSPIKPDNYSIFLEIIASKDQFSFISDDNIWIDFHAFTDGDEKARDAIHDELKEIVKRVLG